MEASVGSVLCNSTNEELLCVGLKKGWHDRWPGGRKEEPRRAGWLRGSLGDHVSRHIISDPSDQVFGKVLIRTLAQGLQQSNRAAEVCLMLDCMYDHCPKHFMFGDFINHKFGQNGWRTF